MEQAAEEAPEAPAAEAPAAPADGRRTRSAGARVVGWVPRRVRAGLALSAVAQAVLVVAQAELLARAVARQDTAPLPWLAAAVALRAGLGWAGGALARTAAARVKAELRAALLARAEQARAGGSGEFGALLTRGLDGLDPYLGGYLPQLATAVVVPPLVLAWLLRTDPPSGLVVLATLPLVPVFGVLVGLRTRDLTRTQWTHLHRLGGHFRDVLAGLPTLRAFDRAEHQRGVVRAMASAHRRATMAALRLAFLSGLVLELVCSLSVALVAVPVGLRLLDGRLELEVALVVLLLTPEAFWPLRAVGSGFHAGAEGVAAAERAFAILDAPAPVGASGGRRASERPARPATERPARPATGEPARPAAPTLLPGAVAPAATGPAEIRLEDVTVRFPGHDRPALDAVRLVVRPGDRIAVVGPSGAGKSTLLHLLLGFVTPDAGRVLVDGVDLARLDPAEWRRHLAWVSQRPRLFAATVADNIRLGAPAATQAQVRAAARAASADAFVQELPDGYDTLLDERAGTLSAGQRQRLALARAYLRDAPLLLLDEPTARLDPRGEAAVVASTIGLLAAGPPDGAPGTGRRRTALLVAHRPALLRAANRVVRLRDGRIEEAP
ncbi:thiol reductant ABC exporter subunit CydD [Allostreptomyces psammosilenae]|uniref:Thiol reductant ABC exporter CydD subunit n=1 Tax=Allostreptomyces psammosilenae TaxID=1892865 RepID=A0A853AAF0_9ACTN|nr:thiol reductant ABC exporter subunit CydD [Allostreptomyces psammosilenae]NYI07352.1 thiol reductant ABC exporter CydD subunit [Allostreptomyces psammosilenae]